MPGSQRVSGSVAKEIRMVQTVQTASAEQLTSLQLATFPLQYHNNISAETILTTLFCFLFIHDTFDIFVTLLKTVTSCCDICGIEARTRALRGRNFRRSCSVLAKMFSMGSLTSLWPWTGIHILREDHLDPDY